MRRSALLAVLIVVVLSLTAFAQNAAPRTSPALEPVPEMQRASLDEVRSLFDSMGAKKQAQDMLGAMQSQMSSLVEQELKKQSPPPSSRVLDALREQNAAILNSMSIDDMLNDMAVVYQKYLTRDEVASLRAFYESAAGKTFMTKLPGIMQEYMQVAMPKQMKRIESVMADLQDRVKKAIAEDQAERRKK